MGVANILDTVIGSIGMKMKKSLSSYNFLETADGINLIAKDGSLATLIKVLGSKQMMGNAELNTLVQDVTRNLSAAMSRSGHGIQVYFSRDPDLAGDVLKDILKTPRNISNNLDLNLDDIFDERQRVLTNKIVPESFYMVLWTRMFILSKQDRKRAKAEKKAKMEAEIEVPDSRMKAFMKRMGNKWPSMVDSHSPYASMRQISARHDAFVSGFNSELKRLGLRVEVMESHDALKAIKASIYPDLINSNWRPYLPGDIGEKMSNKKPHVPFSRQNEQDAFDISHYLWPRLDNQLFDRGGWESEHNSDVMKLGKYYFASLDLTVAQQDLLPFSKLLARMRESEFPWRVSFLVEGDGMMGQGFKNLLASILFFSNSDNMLIKNALKALKENSNEEVVCRLRVSFATWALINGDKSQNGLTVIEERLSRLKQVVEGWGYCMVSPGAGDPIAGTLSSALGLSVHSTAPSGAAPLAEALYMMPWLRDASPFEKGTVLFRTPDCRPWLYSPGAKEQNVSMDIVCAASRRGKSVLLNTVNLAFCLSPKATSGTGGAKLPRVAIIDIGPSSSGLISLLKEALPNNRRHEVMYRRLRMSYEDAINPFDTQLGCRHPLPLERDALINFVSLLGTEEGHATPMGLTNLAGMVVDELYKKFSDQTRDGEPRKYSPEEDYIVDKAIERHRIEINEYTTWWGLTDELFSRGLIREATLAQRFAVPRSEDLMTLRTAQIMDLYGGATVEGGAEKLIDVFVRTISAAVREFPILSVPTRLDLGEARVVSLDLDEAAPSGSGKSEKQTALVYMLARFILAKDFYLNPKVVSRFPPAYQEFHEKRIRRIMETPKRIVMDEFHRTSKIPAVRSQVARDMREGGKWGVQIALASQMITDFNEEIISLATGYWLLGVNNEQDAVKTQQILGISNTAKHILTHRLNGPTKEGAPFLAILSMKDGRHEHELLNTLGPMELWAFSTTQEDSTLRNKIYDAIGPAEGRKKLAKRFPGGTALEEIERRIVILAERGEKMEKAEGSVINALAEEILAN